MVQSKLLPLLVHRSLRQSPVSQFSEMEAHELSGGILLLLNSHSALCSLLVTPLQLLHNAYGVFD